ncbi:MAG: MarR family transcriptional regulator [Deltaproteobacteria bacterium]|nr:MarR family transcriptional regulator [Deltaproteobacteria bacterium]
MATRSATRRLEILDQHIHELIQRFYLRPSMDGPTGELSGSELFALNLVGRRRRCTMSELAKECGLALSSMTGVADRLVAKGCVKRTRDDEEDRRRVFVELDKKGEKIYQALLESEMEMIIAMMDALTPAEQEALLDALSKALGSARN